MPTQTELQQSTGFVLYELWMLRECARMERPAKRVARNLWYEGLAVHSRVLRDFFFTKVNKKDGKRSTHGGDIVAVDYFTVATDWPHTSTKLPAYLTQCKERMDRALAHLSVDRIAFEKQSKDWDGAALATELFEKWFEFMAKLGQIAPATADWFRKHRRAHLVPFTLPPEGLLQP